MKKYFLIYRRLMIANWHVLVSYRSDFVTSILSSLMFSSYHLITVLLLTYKVPAVYGWTRNELLLLASTYSVFVGFYHAFISRNLGQLADEIYYGRLDYVLLKPIDSQVATTMWQINYVSLVRVIFGLCLSWYFINSMHISITLGTVMTYIVVIISGIFILYSFWLPFISLMIFNPRLSNIVMLLYNVINIARYPREMYARLPVYIFAPLIPLAIILTTPTKILLQKFSFFMGIELLSVCVILGLFARFIWKYSLRYYTSASS